MYILGRLGTATGSEELDEDEGMPEAEVDEVEAMGSLTLLEEEPAPLLPTKGPLPSAASLLAWSAACCAFFRAVLAFARRF